MTIAVASISGMVLLMLMPPQQQNDYDFIMGNGGKQPGGSAFLKNPKNRLIASVGFVTIVVILLIIGVNFFLSLGKQDSSDLVDVVAYQTELGRITELGLKNARDPATRVKLATLSSFISSDVSSMKSYLSRNGVKLQPEQVSQRRDSQVESELETAAQLNRYDEKLLEILDEKTAAYKTVLRSALQATTTPNRKSLLDTAAGNIVLYSTEESN